MIHCCPEKRSPNLQKYRGLLTFSSEDFMCLRSDSWRRFPSPLFISLVLVVGSLPFQLAAQESTVNAGLVVALINGDTNQLTGSEQNHYAISAGDTLDITVFGVPELTQKARVNATGDVYMPLVDTVHLAGLNLDQAQKAIEAKLVSGDFVKNPHVNVMLAGYAGGAVLMGEVVKPGIYPVAGSRRLFDVLAAAGGTTQNAGKSVTITHRDDPKPETVYLSSNPRLNMNANILVRQGDTVMVSKAGIVYVVGEVVQPSGFMMDEKSEFTVVKALAMAHGPTKIAALNRARIVRRTPDGVQEISVRLKNIMASKKQDIPLQAEDILFVPTSIAKSTAYRGADVAVGLAAAMTYFSVTR